MEALAAVVRRGSPFDDSFNRLANAGRFAGMEARDRAFARAIAATALRRAGQLRAVLSHFIARPPATPKGDLDEILLAAAAQLLCLKAPAHAVIDLTVDQIKADREARRFHRLANAVLRKVAGEGSRHMDEQQAERLNTPAWLMESWRAAYGEDIALRIAAAHLLEPPLDLTVKSSAATWAERLGGIVLETGTVRLRAAGRIEDLPGYGEGEWWVQDAAAALPALCLGDVEGMRVADLCAAPGGKTAQLAHRGAKVTAVDLSKMRLKRLAANLERLRLTAEIIEADVTAWMPEAPFDAVLLDAPCSATGTIRRNPDIAHLKSPADIEALKHVQSRLISHAFAMLKPGGMMVFCNCSLQPEEGPQQVEAFLPANDAARLIPLQAQDVASHGEWLTAEGYLRTFPHHCQLSEPQLSGMDGFFAARIKKAET